MRKKNVLVAGSGNVTGINIIRGLLSEKINVLGSDYQYNNPANKFCKNEVVPPCKDSLYISKISEIVIKNNITHIIATNDHDVRALINNINIINKLGVKMNGASNTTEFFLDKQETTKMFKENDILTPDIITDKKNFPYVLRINDMGTIKKFVHIISTIEDKENVKCVEFENGIMTRFISGYEYTIDLLCDDYSQLLYAIPRLRVEVRNGMVHYAKIIKDEILISQISQLCLKLSLKGINCIQCIKSNNKYYFIEVNPRPGSGIDLSINAGVNMPAIWVNENYNKSKINWNLKMLRYYDGFFFE